MAKAAGLGQLFFAHGYDISGDVGSLSDVGSPRQTSDLTGISQTAMERALLLGTGQMTFNPWFNDATGQAHAALSGLPNTDVINLWCFGSTAGDAAAGLVSKQTNYDWNRGDDGSLSGSVQALSTAGVPLEWLEMLTAGKITHASATSSASRDDGAGTSNGLVGYLEMVDIDSGTPTVVIEESSDDGAGDAFTTVLSFTAIADTNEPTAERVTVSGTIERYLRVTTTGTFTNADFAVATRRGTANDDTAL